jgi:uncharacterized protein (TIGR03790 family)
MFIRSLPIRAAFWLLFISPTLSAHARELDKAVVVSIDQPGLNADQLGVIVNDNDPESVAIASYYKERRGIPDMNLIHVRFAPDQPNLPHREFAHIKRIVDNAASSKIQALALTWAQPYRVDCMSITSAFAFGFDNAYCADGCKPTKPSPYFDSASMLPYKSYRIRPTMSLAAYTLDQTKKLIDRGVASDGKDPDGTAYLVSTDDGARNVRAVTFDQTRTLMRKTIPTDIVKANFIENKRDVMFYFTGTINVPHIKDNVYLPGAMADHLTSAGGDLFDNGQMSILKWIEAGATGSYGAVAEPCNFLQKFPVPAVAMAHYIQGETLIEAYWKSVFMPGQGIFIGDPLARPFSGFSSDYSANQLRVEARVIAPGFYSVQIAPSMVGPYREAGKISVGWGTREIKLDGVKPGFFRFQRITVKHSG